MKFTFKTEVVPILIILVSVALGFYFYANFPAQVPMHWNVYGRVDSWGSKLEGTIIGPAVILGLYLLFLILPLLDPRREKYQQFAKVYFLFRLLIMLVILGIFLVASLNGLGYNLKVEVWVPLLIGLLFMFMGNYFGKIKPNWFMGIRTPWTLSSDEVWNKTHRLGGKLFILLGMLMIITPLLPYKNIFLTVVIPVAIVSLIPIVYSYVIFRKLKK